MASRDPFGLTPDLDGVIQRPATEVALAELCEALRAGGVAQLHGPPGLGKTLLLWRVAEELGAEFSAVWIPNARLAPDDLWHWIAGSAGIEAGQDAERAVIEGAQAAYASGRPWLLLVDDAGTAPPESARRLREMVDKLGPELRVAAVICVEPPDEDPAASEPDGCEPLSAFEEARIQAERVSEILGGAIVPFFTPMNEIETGAYVRNRLARARTDPLLAARFDADTIARLQRECGGVPAALHEVAEQVLRAPQPDPAVADEPGQAGESAAPGASAGPRLRGEQRVVDWSDGDLARAVAGRGARGATEQPPVRAQRSESSQRASRPTLRRPPRARRREREDAAAAPAPAARPAARRSVGAVSPRGPARWWMPVAAAALLAAGVGLWLALGAGEEPRAPRVRFPSDAVAPAAATPTRSAKPAPVVAPEVAPVAEEEVAGPVAYRPALRTAGPRIPPAVPEARPTYAEARAGARPPSDLAVPGEAAPLHRVSIESASGAALVIDGLARGRAPLYGLQLSEGRHQILVHLPDGGLVEHEIEVGPDRREFTLP